MSAAQDEDFLTSQQVAKALGVHSRTANRLARAHGIGVFWGGSRGWTFVPADIDRLRRAQRADKLGAALPAGADPRGRKPQRVHG